jgi:hypothetical protein
MPVRSLSSSVARWPDRQTVDRALHHWAASEMKTHPDVVKIGYFGSYARGNAGVGSDLDVAIIVKQSDLPFERRAVDWDASSLPVPTDLLVYTQPEWQALLGEGNAFARRVEQEAVWILGPRNH